MTRLEDEELVSSETGAVIEQTVELDGGRVHVRRAGSGWPVLFLHPGPGAGTWNPFFQRIAQEFDLLVPDHPGYGASDDFPNVTGIDGLVDHYHEFIRRCRLDKPVLVGASFGAWIAAEIASRIPEVADVLVLLAPVGIEVQGASVTDVFTLTPAQSFEMAFSSPEAAKRYLAVAAPAPSRLLRRNRRALERFGRSPLLHDPRLAHRLSRVRARTYVVWPECDRIAPRQIAQGFCELIPGAILEVLPGVGHALYTESPQPLADKIVAFAKRASAVAALMLGAAHFEV